MKRGTKRARRYKKNLIYPVENYDEDVRQTRKRRMNITQEEQENFSSEVIKCGGCSENFRLGSNELKIHCNGCSQFFHCKIAGECIGKNCLLSDDFGNLKHRARYCNSCVALIYNKETCMCKECKNLDDQIK